MRPAIDPKEFLALRDDRDAAMRFLVRFAAHAPSSHNTQPWLFKVKDNVIEVWGNAHRALPISDPARREYFVSIGCAIENIIIAGEYYGLPVQVVYFPDNAAPDYVARITVARLVVTNPVLSPDHIAHHISTRHTNRSPFEARAVPGEVVEMMRHMAHDGLSVHVVADEERRSRLATIVADATEAAFHDGKFTEELSHWLKPSLSSYRDGMPGYNIGVPYPISFFMPFALRHFDLAKQQRVMVEAMVNATPAFVLLTTATDTPHDWVLAGRTLERLWLTVEHVGLKLGVFAAGIEIGDSWKEIQSVLGTSERPQVFCRMGYAAKIPPQSPRLKMEQLLVEAS